MKTLVGGGLAKALAVIGLGIFAISVAAVPLVSAVTPGGQINFYDVSGTGSSSTCTTTTWNGGTYSDGNQGFGGNLGADQNIPILANGEEICVNIVFTDQAASTTFTISDPGGFLTFVTGCSVNTTPCPSGDVLSSASFKTDGSGNANVYLIFSVSGLTGDCMTHPLKVSPDISGGEGDAGQIHHYYGGAGACGGTTPKFPPPPSAPQFPLGMALLFVVLVPAFLLFRKRVTLLK